MTTKIIKTVLFASLITAMILPFSGMSTADAEADPFVQATIVFEEIQRLDNEIASGMLSTQEISDRQATIDELWKEIDRLEKLNIEAHTVDPETEQKFYAMNKVLLDKYVFQDSDNYVGNTPILDTSVNFKNRSIEVLVDRDEITKSDLNAYSIQKMLASDIRAVFGEDMSIEIEYGELTPLSCTSRNDVNCRPVLGGLQISKQGLSDPNNTLGYKATKSDGTVGFVMAGHSAKSATANIVHPYNSGTIIGTVGGSSYYCNSSTCDYAWVDAASGISVDAKFYKSSGQAYTQTGKIADNLHIVGTYVLKSGVGTAVTLGTIDENDPNKDYNKVRIYGGGGDSGAPVFKQTSGDNVNLFGMIYLAEECGCHQIQDIRYWPWDHIEDDIGVSPP